MTDTMESLALRDIHLPEEIGWWPPALGWWLAVVFMLSFALMLFYLYKRFHRKTAVKTALKVLKAIKQQPQRGSKTLAELSALLRRVAISTDVRGTVAGLQGQAWLSYLDSSLPDEPFSQGAGRCLADAQFKPELPEDVDFEALFALCERWLKQRGKKQ